MQKPCWIFRLLNRINSFFKLLLKHTVKERQFISNIITDTINIFVKLISVLDKCLYYSIIAITACAGALVTLGVLLLAGQPLSDAMLGKVITHIAYNGLNGRIMIAPVFQVAGLGLITLIGCILGGSLLYFAFRKLYHAFKHEHSAFEKSMLEVKLWNRHEEHIAKNN